MGVHGLWQLLDAFGEVTEPGEWRGRRVAVDASIWMAQFRAQCSAGENVQHRVLEGFFLRILKLLFYGIQPVFVFDGAATSLKEAERRRRAVRREARDSAALTRRAQQIVKAQLASGVLDLQTLEPASTAGAKLHPPPSPRKPASSARAQCLPAGEVLVDATVSVVDTAPRRLPCKRRREVPLEPEAFSKMVTESFLLEAKECIDEKKRGEMCIEANTLSYSSTSLFMGPRRVLEEKMNTPMTYGVPYISDADSQVCIGTYSRSNGESIVVVSEYDSTPNNDNETILTCTSGGDSVVIMDNNDNNDRDAFVSILREIEEAERDSFHDGLHSVCSEEDTIVVSDNSSPCSESSRSMNSSNSQLTSRSTESEDPAVQMWDPGIHHILCEETAEATRLDGDVSYKGNEQFAQGSFMSAKEETNDKSSEATAKDQPGKMDDSKCVTTLPLSSSPLTTHTATASNVIPFELLDIVELLDCCGIPFVLSPHEADAQCAFLSQQEIVDAVFSEDSDVIVHGATVVLRGFFSKGRHVVAYRQRDLMACGVDKDVLVALALLLGCDYAHGVSGVSLVEALRIITFFWRGEGTHGPSHVLRMLTRWRNAVTQDHFVWDDECTLLQMYMNSRKWAALRVDADFPQAHVVDAFFNATVDAELKSFCISSPDWDRLWTFARLRGLLSNTLCLQRLELAQKEFTQREMKSKDEGTRYQLRLTDFPMSLVNKEKVIYKKQPPKIKEVLSALRAVKRNEAVEDH